MQTISANKELNDQVTLASNTAACARIPALSAMLKACGDPLRLQILQVLKSDTFGVLELTQMFETKQKYDRISIRSDIGIKYRYIHFVDTITDINR